MARHKWRPDVGGVRCVRCRCFQRKRASVRIYEFIGSTYYQYSGEPTPPCPGAPESKR